MTQDHAYIFIHGAGLGLNIWDGVRDGMDVPSYALSFPGRNHDAQPMSQFSLRDYVRHLANQLDAIEHNKVIIVAHSIGGILGLELTGLLGERLAGFIGIGAVIPQTGESFVNSLPFPQSFILPLIMKLVGTTPTDAAIRKGLCHDLSHAQSDFIVANYHAESRHLFTEKCRNSLSASPSLYIALDNDRELSRVLQIKMAENMRAQTVTHLASGHLPMLSHPDSLRNILQDFTLSI